MSNQISQLRLIQARVDFIPDGWKLDSVGNALKIKNSLRKPISQSVRSTMQGPYPYYGPTKIQDYISEYEQDGTYALIGEDGDHFLKYSTMKQTQFISGKCTVNNHAHIIDSTKFCSAEWFYIYFQHRNILNFLSRQGAGRYKLNKATLEELPILIPPLLEQQKIAKILTTWDKAINTTERLIENSKQNKKALMQQLLSGQKRLLDDSDQRFSGDWVKTELKNLLHEESTRNKDGLIERVLSVTNHSGFVLPEEQFSKRIASKDTSNYKVVKKGQFGYNPSRLNVGSFARLEVYDEGLLSPMYVVFSVLKTKLDSDFFLQWMHSHEANQRIKNSTQGSVRESVNFDALTSISVGLPPLEEQQKIAAVLTNADREIEVLEQQLADLHQEKKALMQQLLTGKKRVLVD